jgi:hypothetical protein
MYAHTVAELQAQALYFNPENPFNADRIFTYTPSIVALTGEGGWKPAETEFPGFDPIPPDMVIHDLWEHTPGAPASPEEEFMAIGAALYLRYEGGYFDRRNQDTVGTLAQAFRMLYYHAQIRSDKPAASCQGLPAGYQPLDQHATEFLLLQTVTRAYQKMISDPVMSTRIEPILESLKKAAPWMRIGYRKARMRFEGLDVSRLGLLYLRATERIRWVLQDNPEAEGKLVIYTDPRRYKVEIEYRQDYSIEA